MKYHHGNLKENLIQQAVLACEESGWENISLRNLAKQLNVSQTAPYRHFETKEDLLAEVAAKGFEKMNAEYGKEKMRTHLADYIASESPVFPLKEITNSDMRISFGRLKRHLQKRLSFL